MTITKDQVWKYVHEELFQLQPEGYSEEFPNWPGTVGIELEAIPVDLSTYQRVSFSGGLREALVRFSLGNQYRQSSGFYNANGKQPQQFMSPMQLDADGNNMSLEPGGQLEVSTRPFPCLVEAGNALSKEQKAISRHLKESNIGLVFAGIDPENSVPAIGLQIAKDRYECMNSHFQDIGEFGQRMMRQTCTIQVNLDFGRCEKIMSKRYAVAQFFSPILTAMFANSPFVDGKQTPYKSFRGRVWLDVDSSRCGFVGGEPESWFKADRNAWSDVYAQKLWDSSVVMQQKQNSWQRPQPARSFGEWVSDIGSKTGNGPDIDALKLQASLLFPEVRAKGFMELRSIDAQLQKWQTVPGTIMTGALYNEEALDELSALALGKCSVWKQIKEGYLAGLESSEIAGLANKLFQIGLAGVQRLPDCYYSKESLETAQGFYESFTERNLCPADQLIGIAREKGAPLNLKDLHKLGRKQ